MVGEALAFVGQVEEAEMVPEVTSDSTGTWRTVVPLTCPAVPSTVGQRLIILDAVLLATGMSATWATNLATVS